MAEIPEALKGEDRFLWALGLFASRFSIVEQILQRALWHLAGIDTPTAPAVFSGIRTDGAMSFIRRVAEAQKWPKRRWQKFEYVFAQVGILNRLRNDLLHYGATPDTALNGVDQFIISNADFVHVVNKARRMHVSAPLLADAAEDLFKVYVHLGAIVWGAEPKSAPPGEVRDTLRVTLRSAWLYKPPPLLARARKRSRRRPTQKVPRQSSQG